MKRLWSIIIVIVAAMPVQAQEDFFHSWLDKLVIEARAEGVSENTLSALAKVELAGRVLDLDDTRAQYLQTFTGYIEPRVSPSKVRRGRALMLEYQFLLEDIYRQYGIPAHYLVSLWSIESNYGLSTGGFSTLQALVTLTYEATDYDFFSDELMIALKIIDAGHISAEEMTGSLSGGMGQLQFMPSSFARYAVDGDGDGKVDIWDNVPDVLYTAANFLSRLGWREEQRWGREVILPDNFDYRLAEIGVTKTLNEWNNLGITTPSGEEIPVANFAAALVLPSGANGPAFLTYHNYQVLSVDNAPKFYGLAVGHFADRLLEDTVIMNMPVDEVALSVNEIREIQQKLIAMGYNTGIIDGIVGSRTRRAIRSFQQSFGLPMDGYASVQLLDILRLD